MRNTDVILVVVMRAAHRKKGSLITKMIQLWCCAAIPFSELIS